MEDSEGVATMKMVRYLSFNGPSWGVIEGRNVTDLGRLRPDLGWPALSDALRQGSLEIFAEATEQSAHGLPETTPIDDLQLLPVIANTSKILCVGLNYEAHRIETGRERTEFPTIFTRFPETMVGHRSPLVRPLESSHFDYEGELAVVIGREGRRIAERDALNHIAGVTCFNDGSIRDFQSHTSQFTAGKNFPATGSIGPWIVTLDEVGDLSALHLTTRLNGQVMQSSGLGDLTYSIAEIVAYCSSWTTLRPGDVIATGTPAGIGSRRTPPIWMNDGDVCEVEISGVGVLVNPVKVERS
jgi:2-keto-4-pentenoate hydratase/2-oxohepta-3-ene-1,7-dioic acid hydratase in catechol pathway